MRPAIEIWLAVDGRDGQIPEESPAYFWVEPKAVGVVVVSLKKSLVRGFFREVVAAEVWFKRWR